MKSKIVLLFLLINGTYAYSQKLGAIIQASGEEFVNYISEYGNEVIIDVRDSSDFNNRIIKGSIYAATCEQMVKITDTLDYDTPLLVYCFKGQRSQKACEELISKGFKVVINLKQGLGEWDEKKNPLETIHNK
jgi:thiosulfate sulfurtransferase